VKVKTDVWVKIDGEGNVVDCSVKKGWMDKFDGEKFIRGTLTADLPKAKAKRSKGSK
jgi:hypothetical protein